jgi:hypothetical protein
MKVKDLSPQMRLQKAEVELAADPMVTPIGQSSGGLSFFADSFKRGYGNNVFGSDSNGIWLGAADFANAPFKVDMEGNLTSTKATITGIGGNFVSTISWTAVNTNSASWGTGIVKLSTGETYTTDAGSVAGIVAATYVFLDPAVSTTVLQTTTTAANSAGSGRVLLAIITPASGAVTQCSIEVIGGRGTIISGDQIATNSIVANKIAVTSLSAISANLGTITAGSITADVVTTGTLNVARIPSLPASQTTSGEFDSARIPNLSADKITAGNIAAARMQTNVLTALQAVISNLSAIKADIGTVTAGTIDGLTINMPRSSTGGGSGTTGYLKWGGQSKIWSDTDNKIGINSIGSPMYIYVSNSEQVVIPNGGQTTIRNGAYLDGNVNITGEMRCNKITMNQSSDENNIDRVNIIKGYNDVNLQLGNDGYYFSFYNSSFDEKAHIDSSGNIQKDGSVSFDIIHPEIKNYRLRYPAIEAPEVALKIRGVGMLKNGVATISTPHHWSLVNEKDGLITVLLTPMGDCKGLYTPKEKLTFTDFEVRELQNGKSNVEFAWELTCVRKNYLNFNPEYPMTDVQIERMQHMKILKEEKIAELQDEAISLGMYKKDIQDEKDIEVLSQLVSDIKKHKLGVL